LVSGEGLSTDGIMEGVDTRQEVRAAEIIARIVFSQDLSFKN
jgi:hypothetical protein